MSGFNKIQTTAVIISTLSGIVAALMPLWIFFLFLLVPLGLIAGFLVDVKKLSLEKIAMLILFFVAADSLGGILTVFPIVGTIVTTFFASMVAFWGCCYSVSGFRALVRKEK